MRTIVITGFLTMFFVASLFAQTEKYDTKRFAAKVNPNAQLTVSNKYGDVVFVQWEKDSIVAEIEYRVRSNKPQTVEALFKMIDFSYYGSTSNIIISTELRMDYNNLSNLLRSVTAGSNTISINYKIYLPANTKIKATNKFGNIILGNTTANLDITLDNGNLTIGKISGYFVLDMTYGNANIQSVKEGNLSFGFGDLDIRTAQNLHLNSKLSRVNIEEVNKLSINSLRDKYYLGKISVINGKSNFSFMNLQNLVQAVQLNLKYGGIVIAKSGAELKSINLNAEYSNININLSDGIPFDFDIIHSAGTMLTMPSQTVYSSKSQLTQPKNTTRSVGYSGRQNANLKVVVSNKEGQILISNL